MRTTLIIACAMLVFAGAAKARTLPCRSCTNPISILR